MPTLTPTPRPTNTMAAPSATPSPAATVPPTANPTATLSPTPAAAATATERFTVPPTETLTPVPTPTPLTGPIVTAFGVADASGTVNAPTATDEQGRKVFRRSSTSGFIIYIEGRPGASGLPIGTELLNTKSGDPTRQPDLQIESSRDLGDGSVAVCDNSFPNLGGVPGVNPADFAAVQSVSDALNDLACRFSVYNETDFACTQGDSGDFVFSNASSTTQFCTLISSTLTFSIGDTLLTVRLRDTAGNAGTAVSMVVRIIGG